MRGSTIMIVGIGAGASTDFRKAGAALARRCRGRSVLATSIPAVGDDEALIAFVEGLTLASFGYTLATSDQVQPVAQVALCGLREEAAPTLDRARTLARAGWFARLLATVPSNIKTPAWLADQAVALAGSGRLSVKVWDADDLARDGFGGILAVGSGSANPPRFAQIDYRPAKPARRSLHKTGHVVLVGKGITFDSGGLNIKTGEGMRTMKRDMTGAAVVAAVMGALADMDCPVRVTGLMCIAENSVGGGSMRPGDVLTHVNGRTTEVVNTDAEGRLVLADGLAYAVKRLKPDVLVDVATLTGAVKVALGLQTGGVYSTIDALAESVIAAGERAGEPLWRMPLVEEYAETLDSDVADAINAPLEASTITAALFLRAFTAGLPWVHLDIASVGDSVERDEWTAGPTGFGARLLVRWLCAGDALEGVK